MNKLNPKSLSVEFIDGVTTTEPIIPRRYTLTHSDITAELFLDIGISFNYDKINTMRDEVLGEWINMSGNYFYYVYLYVDGQSTQTEKETTIRDSIFRRELPLALEAIRYGDQEFFDTHIKLNYTPIIVYFISNNPKFNTIEKWGTFSDYGITIS